MVGRGQEKAPVALDRSQRLCRCAEVGAGKLSLLSNTRAGDEAPEEKAVFCPSRIECRKRPTRPEFKRWVFGSFPELVSRNTSAGRSRNCWVYAGRPHRSSSNAHPQEPLLEIWLRASRDHFTI